MSTSKQMITKKMIKLIMGNNKMLMEMNLMKVMTVTMVEETSRIKVASLETMKNQRVNYLMSRLTRKISGKSVSVSKSTNFLTHFSMT